jgi:acyl phosphate:glycerol-3-phosphate acyltransferase
MTLLEFALIVLAYLLGSISAAIITCKLMGLPDPRTEGSKNPGATNVLRIGNKKAAALTLFGDFLKGLVPVLIGRLLEVGPQELAMIAMAAFLGHLYPIFFGFQGGKGVATAFGVILGLSWQVALAALLTWLVVAKVFKISSLAALIAATLTPLFCWLLAPQLEFMIMLAVLSLLLIWRHRSNIRNLLSGNEDKITKKE